MPVGGRAPSPGCVACPALGGLLALGGWRDCLAVRVPVAVGAGVPQAVSLRVLRGRGLGFALRVGGVESLVMTHRNVTGSRKHHTLRDRSWLSRTQHEGGL